MLYHYCMSNLIQLWMYTKYNYVLATHTSSFDVILLEVMSKYAIKTKITLILIEPSPNVVRRGLTLAFTKGQDRSVY